mgnify:CR=1 FL=1
MNDLFDRRNHLERAFELYDAQNPEIWELFIRFTGQAMSRGYKHYSVNGIFERIRWHTSVEALPASGDPRVEDRDLKINNNYRPYYARKFHEQFPQHDGFFRTRVLRAAL